MGELRDLPVVVLITVPNSEVAEKIANMLVSEHLAACANIVPDVTSIYFWEGKVCKDKELLLVIKTRASLMRELVSAVRKAHPYTVPEIIALPIVAGFDGYLKWIEDVTREK
ncbi:MAG: divalent-cation tolerance protein CutA [Thermoprotei archaeon]|nr:MAG: divalent-cation tolerance protein CutA [Thermoprotei archaeon]